MKFYDPSEKDCEWNKELNLRLRSLYYESVLEFIEEFSVNGREHSELPDYYRFYVQPFVVPYEFTILLHKATYAREWMVASWLDDIRFDDNKNSEHYIDLDGIELTSR